MESLKGHQHLSKITVELIRAQAGSKQNHFVQG